MPRRISHSMSLPILGCPCGYTTPPPWSDLNVAEHTVQHLQHLDVQRTVAGRHSSHGDALQLCHAQQRLIDELHALAARLRVQLHDRDEIIAQLDADLHDARQLTTGSD